MRQRLKLAAVRYRQEEATAEDQDILEVFMAIKKHHEKDWSLASEDELMRAALQFATPPSDMIDKEQGEDFVARRRKMYFEMLQVATEQKLLREYTNAEQTTVASMAN